MSLSDRRVLKISKGLQLQACMEHGSSLVLRWREAGSSSHPFHSPLDESLLVKQPKLGLALQTTINWLSTLI